MKYQYKLENIVKHLGLNMMLKKLLFLTFYLILTHKSMGVNNLPNVHIRGKYLNCPDEIQELLLQKQGLRTHLAFNPDITISLNKRKEFKIDFYIESASFYDLRDLYFGHTLLIQPGDTINLTLEAIEETQLVKTKKIYTGFAFTMKGEVIGSTSKQGDLHIFDEYINLVGQATKPKDSIAEFKDICEKNIAIGENILEKYAKNNAVSDLFKKWFLEYLNARYTLSMCEVYARFPMDKIPKNYTDHLDKMSFNNPILATVSDKYMTASNVKNWYVYNTYNIKNPYESLRSLFESSRTNYSGIIKDRIMGWCLEDFADKKSLDFDDCYDIFLKECHNPQIKRSVIKKITEKKRNISVKSGKIYTFKDMIMNTNIENYQQKVFTIQQVLSDSLITVLDFGASWCGPCKEQEPIIEEIESRYKNRVQFIYLSGENDEIKWRSSLSKKTESQLSNHFIINEFDSSPIKLYFDISAIPRYVLVSKKRNVALNIELPLPSFSDDFEIELVKHSR